MKNQYVGDIGDYGKYALLRKFIDAGIKLGVNWYLTENDSSTDGKYTEYLRKDDLRYYHTEVFDSLLGIAFDDSKTVRNIEESDILPRTSFYSDCMKFQGKPLERKMARQKWFEKSESSLAGSELIFMDPDNGLLENGDGSKKGSEKYVLPEEVEEYFYHGNNVVYYCHKGRRSVSAWKNYLYYMFDRIPEAMPIVLTYHKGTQRSYVFLIHQESFKQYREIIDTFKWQWSPLFSEEYTNKGGLADNKGDVSIIYGSLDELI